MTTLQETIEAAQKRIQEAVANNPGKCSQVLILASQSNQSFNLAYNVCQTWLGINLFELVAYDKRTGRFGMSMVYSTQQVPMVQHGLTRQREVALEEYWERRDALECNLVEWLSHTYNDATPEISTQATQDRRVDFGSWITRQPAPGQAPNSTAATPDNRMQIFEIQERGSVHLHDLVQAPCDK